MKIVIVGPTYPFRGGISHYTTLLCLHLQKKHQIRFYTFSRPYPKKLYPGDASFDPSETKLIVEAAIACIDWANPFSWIKVGLSILRWSPHLIVFPWWMWGWSIPFWTIAKIATLRANTKILFLCHNVIEHESTFWKVLFSKFVLSTGNFYIVHSHGDYKNLKKMLPNAKVTISFHPTYEVFELNSASQDSPKKGPNISNRLKKTILFFGVVRPYKGLEYLIKAMPQIINKLPDLCLVIAGEFWEDKTRYLKLIQEYGLGDNIMVFDSYIPNEEIAAYFSIADLVVLPYVSATGSGVTQIAFGFNKPVVATSVGDLPRVVEHGRRGLIVPPQESTSLANAIIQCFEDGVIKTFSENIKNDRYLFSWDHLTNIIESKVLTA